MNAKQIVIDMITDSAGTSDADHAVLNAAADLILSRLHVRKCRNCGSINLHEDGITPYVLCKQKECRSADTRRIR